MTATPDRHDGESFRISHCGYHIGYARSVPELERWIELADLQEALIQARRAGAMLSPPSRGPAAGHTRPTGSPPCGT